MARTQAMAIAQKHKQLYRATVFALIASVLYSSWLLEAYLNPAVAQHHGVASELGALGQPYNWLFNSLDIISGLAVTTVAVVLYRLARQPNPWLKLALFSYGTFGVLTVVDAAVPMRCLPSFQTCGSIWNDPQLLLHGTTSIVSSTVLLLSAFAIWRLARLKSSEISLLMYIILNGWAIFGVLSVVYFVFTGPDYLAQHYFITLCSVWVGLMPIVYAKLRLVRK